MFPLKPPSLYEDPWTEAELHEFVTRAIAEGLGDRTRRETLLLHVPRSLRDRLPMKDTPEAQLISDLRILAALRPPYFEQWRDNAAELVHSRFAQIIRKIKTRPDPYPPPPKPRPPPPRRPKTLIMVALIFALAAIGFVGWTLLQGPAGDPAGRSPVRPASVPSAPKSQPPG